MDEVEKLKQQLAEAEAKIAAETAAKEKAIADKNKILNEKKELMDSIFTKEEKEGMTDTERKLAEEAESLRSNLAKESEARQKAEEDLRKENETRQKAENDRIAKGLEERITKAAKGDTAVADKLKANVALLEKMPRLTDSDLDAIVNTGWNMMGIPESNPLNSISSMNSNDAKIDDKPSFGETQEGKALASKLGLSFAAEKPAENKGDEGNK